MHASWHPSFSYAAPASPHCHPYNRHRTAHRVSCHRSNQIQLRPTSNLASRVMFAAISASRSFWFPAPKRSCLTSSPRLCSSSSALYRRRLPSLSRVSNCSKSVYRVLAAPWTHLFLLFPLVTRTSIRGVFSAKSHIVQLSSAVECWQHLHLDSSSAVVHSPPQLTLLP